MSIIGDPQALADLPGSGAVFEFDDVALFLDLDGTLAAISERPDHVGPDPVRNELLAQLHERLEGRVAIVSGRTIDDVDRIVEGRVRAVAGVHGLERRRADGLTEHTPPHPTLPVAREAFAAAARVRRGLRVEDKGRSVALHYRQAPGASEALRELAGLVAESTGLLLKEGKMVVELLTPGADKGDAVAAFMEEAPFSGARPVFIGDDLTDEDAFATVAVGGGYGVLVGPARQTWARWRLRGVDDVLGWLAAALSTTPTPQPEPVQ